MPDILHRVGVLAPPAAVYGALTTVDGLAGWWTRDTAGDGGGTLLFRFGEVGGFDMQVVDLRPDRRVAWEVVDGPAEWVGTTVTFDLLEQGE